MSLFDHLVGAGEERRGHLKAERLRGLHVQDELEFGRLQHRQIGWSRTVENKADIMSDLAIPISKIGAVTQETAGLDLLTEGVDRGQRIARRQDGKLNASGPKRRVVRDQKPLHAFFISYARKDSSDLVGIIIRDQNLDCLTDRSSGSLGLFDNGFVCQTCRCVEYGDMMRVRQQFVQDSELLARKVRCLRRLFP
jgi:hypothetical protein